MSDSNKTMQPNTTLTARCIAHLTSEVELLEEYLEFTSTIYESFGQHDTDIDARSTAWNIVMADRSKLQHQRRDQIRKTLADAMRVDESRATIRLLIDRLPTESEDAETLRQLRQRLLDLETTIQGQNRTNSLLIRQSMDLYQRIADELTNQKSSTPTYSPKGQLTRQESTGYLKTDC